MSAPHVAAAHNKSSSDDSDASSTSRSSSRLVDYLHAAGQQYAQHRALLQRQHALAAQQQNTFTPHITPYVTHDMRNSARGHAHKSIAERLHELHQRQLARMQALRQQHAAAQRTREEAAATHRPHITAYAARKLRSQHNSNSSGGVLAVAEASARWLQQRNVNVQLARAKAMDAEMQHMHDKPVITHYKRTAVSNAAAAVTPSASAMTRARVHARGQQQPRASLTSSARQAQPLRASSSLSSSLSSSSSFSLSRIRATPPYACAARGCAESSSRRRRHGQDDDDSGRSHTTTAADEALARLRERCRVRARIRAATRLVDNEATTAAATVKAAAAAAPSSSSSPSLLLSSRGFVPVITSASHALAAQYYRRHGTHAHAPVHERLAALHTRDARARSADVHTWQPHINATSRLLVAQRHDRQRRRSCRTQQAKVDTSPSPSATQPDISGSDDSTMRDAATRRTRQQQQHATTQPARRLAYSGDDDAYAALTGLTLSERAQLREATFHPRISATSARLWRRYVQGYLHKQRQQEHDDDDNDDDNNNKTQHSGRRSNSNASLQSIDLRVSAAARAQRWASAQQRRDAALAQTRRARALHELRECTFQPHVQHTHGGGACTTAATNTATTTRSSSRSVIQRVQLWQQQRNARVAVLRDELRNAALRECTFKPHTTGDVYPLPRQRPQPQQQQHHSSNGCIHHEHHNVCSEDDSEDGSDGSDGSDDEAVVVMRRGQSDAAAMAKGTASFLRRQAEARRSRREAALWWERTHNLGSYNNATNTAATWRSGGAQSVRQRHVHDDKTGDNDDDVMWSSSDDDDSDDARNNNNNDGEAVVAVRRHVTTARPLRYSTTSSSASSSSSS